MKLFKSGDDWTFELLEKTWKEIDKIGKEDFGLDYYFPQIEIVSAEQMLDAYSSVGLPIYYKHWSFGKTFINDADNYKAGRQSLAYEIVINSDPCIAYLMEQNNMTMQALVMAHACVGHSAFFKGNYLSKYHTNAGTIVDYLTFVKSYIKMCEEKYGVDRVEKILDACHSLQFYGIDKYKRPEALNVKQEEEVALKKFESRLSEYDLVWEKVLAAKTSNSEDTGPSPFNLPEDNILYFIEKYSPTAEPWVREIIKIVRNLSQYFYPQMQTKVINEGFATFTHYNIMNRLYEKKLIDFGSMFDFLVSHNNVTLQPDYTSNWYSGINPYALGFAIFQDVKRMCLEPTDEDRRLFPNVVGQDWKALTRDIMRNHNDETFILQYFSPTVARKMKMFYIHDDMNESHYEVKAVADDNFEMLRTKLSQNYSLSAALPNIQITDVDRTTRGMMIRHLMKKGDLALQKKDALMTVHYLAELWGSYVTFKFNQYDDNKELVEETLTHFSK